MLVPTDRECSLRRDDGTIDTVYGRKPKVHKYLILPSISIVLETLPHLLYG